MSFEEHITTQEKYPNIFFVLIGGCCVYYPSNIFHKATPLASIFYCLQMMGYLLVQKKVNCHNLLAQVSCQFTSFNV